LFKLRGNLRNTESLFYPPHGHFQYSIHKYDDDTVYIINISPVSRQKKKQQRTFYEKYDNTNGTSTVRGEYKDIRNRSERVLKNKSTSQL